MEKERIEKEQQRRKQILDKGQMVVSNSADFEEGTWTFNTIGDDAVIAAGTFIVIPLEKFEELQSLQEERDRLLKAVESWKEEEKMWKELNTQLEEENERLRELVSSLITYSKESINNPCATTEGNLEIAIIEAEQALKQNESDD